MITDIESYERTPRLTRAYGRDWPNTNLITPKAAGSNPAPATKKMQVNGPFRTGKGLWLCQRFVSAPIESLTIAGTIWLRAAALSFAPVGAGGPWGASHGKFGPKVSLVNPTVIWLDAPQRRVGTGQGAPQPGSDVDSFRDLLNSRNDRH